MDDAALAASHYLLAIRCMSLAVDPKASFAGRGLFANLYAIATNTTQISSKNERRVLKLSQSEPFATAKRPASLDYGLLFTSEVFEDRQDIAPCLLAKVRRNDGMDSKFRVNVYYSSSLTGNKEVLLAATSFSERELLRAAATNNGEFASDMLSEYCSGAKAYIQVVPWLAPLLDQQLLPVTAPTTEKNPLTQRYVFYHEQDNLSPYLDVSEQTWEPRHSGKVAVAFLSNFADSLQRSITAWRRRYVLEQTRQGRFSSVEEAHFYRWHSVQVCVKAARFRRRPGPTVAAANSATAAMYQLHFPLGSEYTTQPMASKEAVDAEETEGSEGRVAAHSSTSAELKGSSRRSNNSSKRKTGYKEKTPRKVDETALHSFVEVAIVSPHCPFALPLGRTNTEYFTCFPVYGVNLNAGHVRKAFTAAVAGEDNVKLHQEETEIIFCVYETMNKDFVPQRYRAHSDKPGDAGADGADEGRSNSGAAEEEAYTFAACTATQTHFQRFISAPERCWLLVTLYTETNGVSKAVGSTMVPLTADLFSTRASVWLPLSAESEEGASSHASVNMSGNVEDIEVLISLSLQSPVDETRAFDLVALETLAPASMTEVCYVNRACDGSVPWPDDMVVDAERHVFPYQRVLSDCYEWLWSVGFSGHDPLLLLSSPRTRVQSADHTPALRREGRREGWAEKGAQEGEDGAAAVGAGRSEGQGGSDDQSPDPPEEDQAQHRASEPDEGCARQTMSDNDSSTNGDQEREEYDPARITEVFDQGIGPGRSIAAPRRSMVELSLAADSDDEVLPDQAASDAASAPTAACATVPSPLSAYDMPDFIKERVDVSYPLNWLLDHIESMQQLHTSIRKLIPSLQSLGYACFRPSPSKKVEELQPLPINLHYQLLGIRRHCNLAFAQKPLQHLLSSVTCGALSPHALGHKQGGLLHQLVQLSERKSHLQKSMEKYVKMLQQDYHVDADGYGPHRGAPAPLPYLDQRHPAYSQLQQVLKEVQGFESACIGVAYRQALTLSQALCVAIACVLLKLNTALMGQVDDVVLRQWQRCGFLIVFEGLLSVTGSEQGMLEDTASAVQALRVFQIEILRADAAPEDAAQAQDVDVAIAGRSVRLTLPASTFDRLPRLLQQPTPLKLAPVLFTQGIDLQQTMAATFGSTTKGKHSLASTSLQHKLNVDGVLEINRYCSSSRPVTRGSVLRTGWSSASASLQQAPPIHPLVQELHNALSSSSTTSKNVDLLAEVERLCLLLDGVRVTFCKSGKDRTSMAVTLDQARQLGERFGAGVGVERCMQDSHLMRLHGTRLAVAEKNIGKPVYSFNILQVQFLPLAYRPPLQVCEDILKKDNS